MSAFGSVTLHVVPPELLPPEVDASPKLPKPPPELLDPLLDPEPPEEPEEPLPSVPKPLAFTPLEQADASNATMQPAPSAEELTRMMPPQTAAHLRHAP
jgi:hypothetical protein